MIVCVDLFPPKDNVVSFGILRLIRSNRFVSGNGKPWFCTKHNGASNTTVASHRACFRLRQQLEKSWGQQPPTTEEFLSETTQGYCTISREKGYVPLVLPNATEENVDVFSNLDVPAASKSDSIERSKHTEIAFVISVAKCEAAANGLLLDGPAVLAESTRLVQSKYHNDLIAFVHPNATSCSQRLLFFGYKIVEQDLGFQKHNTSTSRRYRQTIDYKGCCDSLEFKQLEAFTVTECMRLLCMWIPIRYY